MTAEESRRQWRREQSRRKRRRLAINGGVAIGIVILAALIISALQH